MIDLIIYGTDQYKDYTIQYASAYVKATRFLASNKIGDIKDFIKESPNSYILFVGGPTRVNARVLGPILSTQDHEIKTFNISDLNESFFEPREPCYSYMDYSLDLSRSRGRYSSNVGVRQIEYLNPVFAMTKERFKLLGELDEKVDDHLDIYFSLLNRYMSGVNYLDMDVTVATKTSLSQNEDILSYLGQQYVKGFRSAYKALRGKEPLHDSLESKLQGELHKYARTFSRDDLELEFIEHANHYKGRSASLVLTDKLQVLPEDICISTITDRPAHYYVVQQGAVPQVELISNLDVLNRRAYPVKKSHSSRDGFIFRDRFTDFGTIETIALQLCGFLGFSSIHIYEDKSRDENFENIVKMMCLAGIKVVRHSIC